MSNIEFRRNHKGELDMFVSGHPAQGARVTIMQAVEGDMTIFVAIPLKHATLGEVANVVPLHIHR